MSGTITLMGETITVAAQPWNRLASKATTFQEGLGDTDVTALGMGKGVYDALCTLAPEVKNHIPFHRWMGFASQESMDAADAGAFGDEVDTASVPEIKEAFKSALDINGWDLVSNLSQFVDPTVWKPALKRAMTEALATTSSQSQSENGTSQLTNGSPPSQPTATKSGAGRSPASKRRSEAAS